MSSLPLEIAETIQTASINFKPSPEHDINPSTAASDKIPVKVDRRDSIDSYSSSIVGSDYGDNDEDYYTVRPTSRKQRQPLPPLPDLRFEQSYLRSIEGADTYGKIALITIRDQVLLPLIQGTLWTLALHGWRHWNRATKLNGRSMGAKIRRWWWSVNNWPIEQKALDLFKKTVSDEKLARRVGEFYETQTTSD